MQIHHKKHNVRNKWDDSIWVIVFLGTIAFFISIWYSLKTGKWYKRIHKTRLAGLYGLQKSETLMKWVELHCPSKVSEKYVGKQIQYIIPTKIIPYIGSPDDYPRDGMNRKITSKKEMARAFAFSEKVVSRRIQALEDAKDVIGLDYDTYSKMKRIPPRFSSLIFNYIESCGYEVRIPKASVK